jgi:hypothetical protein
LMAGALAHWIGAPRTVMLTGTCCTLVAIWFTFRLPRMNAVMQLIYHKTAQLPSDELEPVAEEAAH